jgi:PhnB protein
MATKLSPVPEGYGTLTPYLIVHDGAAALDFYAKVFGAIVGEKLTTPDGRVMHAELQIGTSKLMLGEHQETEPRNSSSFPRLSIYSYVENADEVARRAVAAGAKELSPVSDKFYGNREGGIEDPFGIVWWIATRVEEVTPEEVARRAAAARPS